MKKRIGRSLILRVSRRGVSAVQAALVLVLIAGAVIVAARSMSTPASNDMNNTASEIGDPSKLADRFLP